MHKKEILDKIKNLDGLNNDEKAYLVNLINTKKKYGLVWEDKPEDVEEQLRTHLPVLREVVEKRILASEQPITKTNETPPKEINLFSNIQEKNTQPVILSEACTEPDEVKGLSQPQPQKANGQQPIANSQPPNHILIEGDNLHALTALTFTHEGKIDAMYFDPPYNTGAKDWRYNNDFVIKEDSFRHSKWVSMMFKRLQIAKRLLKVDGIICVTIDDYEMPRLTMIMEEIFGEENHLGTIAIRINPSGRSTVKGVSITHEYALFFGISENASVGRLPRNEKQTNRYDLIDEKSAYEWVNFRKHGGMRKESPSMYYPIYITEGSLRIPDLKWSEESKEWIALEDPIDNEVVVFPIDDNGQDRRWKWGLERIRNSPNEFCVKKDRNGKLAVYVKARMTKDGVLPLTWWDKKEYSATAYGTNLIKEIFGELQVFSYPKALHAVIDSIRVLTNKPNAVILDIFAGSGTTLHATMQLNSEDGGNRQCILVTNNENNICEEVTYERNKRVIQGYTNSKGIEVPGLSNNNLRYYKSEFVERKPTLTNKRKLTQLATELLCIKEDCYTEVTSQLQKAKWHKCFSNGQKNYVYIVYDDMYVEEAVTALKQFIAKQGKDIQIKVYVFSNGQYPYTEEFEDIADNITLAALPDAIYKAYQNILPKENKEFIPELEEDSIAELENDTQE